LVVSAVPREEDTYTYVSRVKARCASSPEAKDQLKVLGALSEELLSPREITPGALGAMTQEARASSGIGVWFHRPWTESFRRPSERGPSGVKSAAPAAAELFTWWQKIRQPRPISRASSRALKVTRASLCSSPRFW
jgi:hypothetical protein